MSTPNGQWMIGLDVGSTTVKAIVVDPETNRILWQAYERHETRQAEKALEFLEAIERRFPRRGDPPRAFITGSGGNVLAPFIGARFVQEVNAVSLAVETLHPDAGSVIELGGQDAKIIIWIPDPTTGKKRKFPSMNDKCAGGTGAVIDKITSKLKLGPETLGTLSFADQKLHPVAGKCGVFAETDINGLQKQGVPAPELMASLFEAIVQQNLSVLTRGNTLRPRVLLLGGPNTFIPAMRDAWRANIPRLWAERKTPLPEWIDPADLIVVPENAQFFGALGAVLYGKEEEAGVGIYKGRAELARFVQGGRKAMRAAMGEPGLLAESEGLESLRRAFGVPSFTPARFSSGERVEAYLGIDGGSTSTKAVLMDPDGAILAKSYRLSAGNPLDDTREILRELDEQVKSQGASLAIRGVGTTGYAKDMLKETLLADIAIVETVAHTQSALHYHSDADVIVDVGGQDIKVIFLKHGAVKDFRLNTQCSAGNGYFLQATAEKFGYAVADFADAAFKAERLPVFSYGCAVFLESDIVNFQQLGWEKEEILAGMARVLPKNIWLYVVQEPNLAKLGRTFVLQGGTQHNLAAVKAQADFIGTKVPGARILVHPHTGESGAIGAALEARRVVPHGRTAFVGIEAAASLSFTTTRDESTRCNFCKNDCLRTFIDTKPPEGDARRFIIATCEKGMVESLDDLRKVKGRFDRIKKENPNFVEIAGDAAFRSTASRKTDEAGSSPASGRPSGKAARWLPLSSARARREKIRIGIPRVLNFYSTAPFFVGYLESAGVPFRNIVFSTETDNKMYKEGSRRGSIDQCFPSKAVISHVHQLIQASGKKGKSLDLIFFPALMNLQSSLTNTLSSQACPTVSATPSVVKAAFTKEGDLFAEKGIRFADPIMHMAEPALLDREMWAFWRQVLRLSRKEHRAAMETGWQAMDRFANEVQRAPARALLDRLEAEGRVGVVLLGRPYHNDPGLNHEILTEIQKRGYPVFTMDSLPTDADLLDRFFGEEIKAGAIKDPMDITDVWKNAYSANSSWKIWAAKFTARHPNLAAVDLSNFKCGHDAPIYDVVESILEATATPYFSFHDIDENRPAGSIKIRIETIDYFLRRYEEGLRREKSLEAELEERVQAYRAERFSSLFLTENDLKEIEMLSPAANPSGAGLRSKERSG